MPLEQIAIDLAARDGRDLHRTIALLQQAADAVRLDSSDKTFDEAVKSAIEIITSQQCDYRVHDPRT